MLLCCLQLAYDKSVTDTACFVSNTRFERNAVFHAVGLAKGERVDWRKFEGRRASETAKALQKGGSADLSAVDKVELSTFSTMRCDGGSCDNQHPRHQQHVSQCAACMAHHGDPCQLLRWGSCCHLSKERFFLHRAV